MSAEKYRRLEFLLYLDKENFAREPIKVKKKKKKKLVQNVSKRVKKKSASRQSSVFFHVSRTIRARGTCERVSGAQVA